MNKLPLEKRVQILNMLVEGMSMRAASRLADASINTISKLLVDAGEACAAFHYETAWRLQARRVQCDEIWSFCYAKQKNVAKAKAAPAQAGDVWTWTALDSDSKYIIAWMVGDRDTQTAYDFIDDVARRIDGGRVQITTDGFTAYHDAVRGADWKDGVDYAMLVKYYGELASAPKGPERKYSPGKFNGSKKKWVAGNPDWNKVSTSHVERHNLSVRMANRRFTRLTNAFSKKIDNHIHMLSLYFVWYNHCRIHKTLRVTPAVETGADEINRDMEWIVGLIDARSPKPGPRGPYKKQEETK